MVRSGSSAGANNYRATRRAKSNADFISKFKIVEEKLDEPLFFPEMIVELNKDKGDKIATLYKGRVRTKMTGSTLKTLRKSK